MNKLIRSHNIWNQKVSPISVWTQVHTYYRSPLSRTNFFPFKTVTSLYSITNATCCFFTRIHFRHYVYKYKTTRNADCLSRLLIALTTAAERDVVDVYEIEIVQNMLVSVEQLTQATAEYTQIQEIIKALRGKKEIPAKLRFNVNQAAFSIQQEIFLYNGKVVIPIASLRTQFLCDLHRSHFGAAKMKALARGLYWWPDVDKAIDEIARNCNTCNLLRNNSPRTEIHEWETEGSIFR